MALDQLTNSNSHETSYLDLTNEEYNKIRGNKLYKGQLAYLKEIILKDCPRINPSFLSERLDIPLKTAIVLLKDCTG